MKHFWKTLLKRWERDPEELRWLALGVDILLAIPTVLATVAELYIVTVIGFFLMFVNVSLFYCLYRCPECGAFLGRANVRFCPSCGHKFPGNDGDGDEPKPEGSEQGEETP